MAIPILSILKAVAPLAVRASDIVSTYVGLSNQRSTLALEEQVRRIENESARAGEVLRVTTEQLLALAEQVRIQQRRVWLSLGLAGVSLVVAIVALVRTF